MPPATPCAGCGEDLCPSPRLDNWKQADLFWYVPIYVIHSHPSPVSWTSHTDATVVAGQLYHYAVAAVDSSGVESVYANQASATFPLRKEFQSCENAEVGSA